MQHTLLSPSNNDELQNQALNYVNQLSALYSIPLIVCIYYNGCSIEQMRSVRNVFEILVSKHLYFPAFNG